MLCGIVFDADASQCEVDFSIDQIITMQKAYDYGQTYDYGYSLAAISWQESSAGLNLVGGVNNVRNLNNVEYLALGPFHNLLKTVKRREKCESVYCEQKIIARLITDFDYGAMHASLELNHWQAVHKSDWFKMWSSYYAGNKWQNGKDYATDITNKVRYIKKCIDLGN